VQFVDRLLQQDFLVDMRLEHSASNLLGGLQAVAAAVLDIAWGLGIEEFEAACQGWDGQHGELLDRLEAHVPMDWQQTWDEGEGVSHSHP
jgi:hypothetical protein